MIILIMLMLLKMMIIIMTPQMTHHLLYLPSYVAAGVLLVEVIHSLEKNHCLAFVNFLILTEITSTRKAFLPWLLPSIRNNLPSTN